MSWDPLLPSFCKVNYYLANNSKAEVLADIELLFYGLSLCGFGSALSNVEKFDVEES